MAAREAVHLFQQLGQGHARVLAGKIGRDEIRLAMKQVGLNPDMRKRVGTYSLGMRQRLGLAQAIMEDPPILLLDEVTTGLDLSVQAKVLDLIRSIQKELGIAMMVVSHDLAVIRMMSDRTMVMLGGRVVEEGLTDQILEDPLHEYTQTLVSSLL